MQQGKKKKGSRKLGRSKRNGQAARYRVSLQRERNKLKRIERPRAQDRLDPFWMRFSGGCHLNRKIDDLLADAGFRIDRLETGYIPGPRIMTFFYEGAARPR
jgi:hypothetical protein